MTPEELFERYVQDGIARSPEPLRELGEYLGKVLDEDEFPTANELILQLATSAPIVDDAMVGRATEAMSQYWQDGSHVTKCERCSGTGAIAVGGHSQDWCHECGGSGTFHAGTEDGALRAALIAALTRPHTNQCVAT